MMSRGMRKSNSTGKTWLSRHWRGALLLLGVVATATVGVERIDWTGTLVGLGPFKLKTQAVRVKFSSTQVVHSSSMPGDSLNYLNLDNVGTLAVGIGNADHVQMMLLSAPALVIDNPFADLARSAKGTSDSIPPEGAGLADAWRDIHIEAGSDMFDFERVGRSRHVVRVDKRRFEVVLRDVRDRSSAEYRLYEYTFIISEL